MSRDAKIWPFAGPSPSKSSPHAAAPISYPAGGDDAVNCYLFSHAAVPMLEDFMKAVDTDIIGKGMQVKDDSVDDRELIEVNAAIRNHPIESVGQVLRGYMTAMKKVV